MAVRRSFFFIQTISRIAPTGQMATQAPQLVQSPASILYTSAPSVMISTGHSLRHAPQQMHSFVISYAMFPLRMIMFRHCIHT